MLLTVKCYLNIQDYLVNNMKWILKYYIKSKYLGYSKVYYKEFELLDNLKTYIRLNNIINYEIYERIY